MQPGIEEGDDAVDFLRPDAAAGEIRRDVGGAEQGFFCGHTCLSAEDIFVCAEVLFDAAGETFPRFAGFAFCLLEFLHRLGVLAAVEDGVCVAGDAFAKAAEREIFTHGLVAAGTGEHFLPERFCVAGDFGKQTAEL